MSSASKRITTAATTGTTTTPRHFERRPLPIHLVCRRAGRGGSCRWSSCLQTVHKLLDLLEK